MKIIIGLALTKQAFFSLLITVGGDDCDDRNTNFHPIKHLVPWRKYDA